MRVCLGLLAMLRCSLALIVVLAAFPACADLVPVYCAGDPALRALSGTWVSEGLLKELRRSRSWSITMNSFAAGVATVYVRPERADFNLGWHESDTGKVCVRRDGGKLWAQRDGAGNVWQGPYLRTRSPEAETYLDAFFKGCYRSDHGERWCLAPQAISIDGKVIEARLQMDLSEGPFYGTPFATRLTALPLTVFLPVDGGWDVYQDDWASAPGRTADPAHSQPWRRLRDADVR